MNSKPLGSSDVEIVLHSNRYTDFYVEISVGVLIFFLLKNVWSVVFLYCRSNSQHPLNLGADYNLSTLWLHSPFKLTPLLSSSLYNAFTPKQNDVERIIISFGINMLHMWSDVNEKFFFYIFSYFSCISLEIAALQHTKRKTKI